MKRSIAIIISLVMTAALFSACGENNSFGYQRRQRKNLTNNKLMIA